MPQVDCLTMPEAPTRNQPEGEPAVHSLKRLFSIAGPHMGSFFFFSNATYPNESSLTCLGPPAMK